MKKVQPEGHPSYHFDWQNDLIFEQKTVLPGHTNGIAFEGLDVDNNVLLGGVIILLVVILL
ncbi:hypothetical protein H704_00528 [Bartonella bacilliformis Peru38]|uniref:hypothetical protein n=1 Tax=Bartonella bacilliformis TaxID=774 RepID=UPI0000674805|nr:hypothetical protein X472_00203 [Bartonella bacilliformis San Pedro600-02]EYS95106.1 hypothetical protein X470_00622 [Bartonella bacilliformis Peru-18]KEG16657.1 hypothetical protein H705_00531 [Bartonella bacilliformis Cond044]KEG17778.1 hypothetical protein H709_00514 [Bartonella bacilliformis CUSCO5]KEG20986.1 hypothetical protein H704_00528 [Bartonella bacilliformis Peru38]KEG22680.1 hypothetical protein H703_00515 [Bartonella bacilliformis Ver075]